MESSYRLSKAVVPKHYELKLEPDLEKGTFRGEESIELEIKEPTKKITLNSLDLSIKEAFLTLGTKKVSFAASFDTELETVTLESSELISPGMYVLSLVFCGSLRDDLSGFYRSVYMDGQGNKKSLATTQFEAPYARRAFPCFDEPSMKATFSVSLVCEKSLVAISNMPVSSEAIKDSKKHVSFETTPVMSTYLLYVGVGDFERISEQHGDIEIGIVTTPGKSEQGRFALDVAKKVLDYFESYSGISYPLPKLDMLAIPDFSAGAMENWGAITYREVVLLYEEGKTSFSVKKRIAEVIAHELWHQWSGNLVTMGWWNDLWLNESFATYMAYKALDHLFPEWNIWEDFVEQEIGVAFKYDSLRSTHPIEVSVHAPSEIEEIFDAISYNKGGAVLRMLESYLTSEVFQKGVSTYLKDFSYGNATAGDLWDALEAASGDSPIREMIEDWIRKPGYPIVFATSSSDGVLFSQKRYGCLLSSHEKDALWRIPLVIRAGDETKRVTLEKSQMTIPFEANFFKVNTGGEGFYRVSYDLEFLKMLTPVIASGKLGVIDRWNIHNDFFNLTLSGDIGLDSYFDFLKSYQNETSHLVLLDIFSSISKIYHKFSGLKELEGIWEDFFSYMKQPFAAQLARLGWEEKNGESYEDILLRSLCIEFFVFIGDEAVLSKARELFSSFASGSRQLSRDLKTAVFYGAAKHGDAPLFDLMEQLYEKTDSVEEKIKLLAALYKFENEDLIRKALDFSLGEGVRSQELPRVYTAVSSNIVSKDLFFDWVRERWNALEKHASHYHILRSLLASLILPQTGMEKKEKLKEFFDSKNIGYAKTQDQYFEFMDINTLWVEKNKDVLKKYFSKG